MRTKYTVGATLSTNGTTTLEVQIYKDGAKDGRIFIRDGSFTWYPKCARHGYRLTWGQIGRLLST